MINGKPVDEHEIPAFVLEQIKGRQDLPFNEMHRQEEEEEVGDLYDIQDAEEEDEEYDYEEEEYSDEEWSDEEGSEEWE